jgi:enamine deaminase RidA (YjgF/YER057c/UK114 family)
LGEPCKPFCEDIHEKVAALMAGAIERRLAELNIALPVPPPPAANYAPFVREGNLVQLAGVAPSENGRYAVLGKLGRDLKLEDGRRAARLCALNALANLKAACDGDLDIVQRFIMVRGFVNASEDFEDTPLVMNGASDLIVEIFGSFVGTHARTSVGCATLPGRVAVEIDALVLIDKR